MFDHHNIDVPDALLPSRRTIARGSVWTVPALIVGSVARASAASTCTDPAGCPVPSLSLTASESFQSANGNSNNGTATLSVTGKITIAGTTTTTSITTVRISIFSPHGSLTFSGGTQAWPNPTYVGTTTIGGVTYYEYDTTLSSTPTTGTSGSTVLTTPTFTTSFSSTKTASDTIAAGFTTVINTTTTTKTSGVGTIPNSGSTTVTA